MSTTMPPVPSRHGLPNLIRWILLIERMRTLVLRYPGSFSEETRHDLLRLHRKLLTDTHDTEETRAKSLCELFDDLEWYEDRQQQVLDECRPWIDNPKDALPQVFHIQYLIPES